MQPDVYVPPPDHPLHGRVRLIFALRARPAFARELILPSAEVDLLFNLGDALRGRSDEIDLEFTGTRICGVRTQPLCSTPTGEVNLIGVNLEAARSAEIIPIPAHELTDRAVDAALVFPDAEQIRERLCEARSFHERCVILLDWLMRHWRPRDRGDALGWACRQLGRDPGALTRVAREIGVSGRQLHRLFVDRIGLAPTRYIRLRRFVAALHLMRPGRSLSEVALAAGYFDQPHFCRDFRDFARMTPREYLGSVGPVPGHIYAH